MPIRDNHPKILFLPDGRLSREKSKIVNRLLNTLRQHFRLQVLRVDTGVDEVLAHLKKERPALVLVPWDQYLDWRKIEAHLGMNRILGPTFAGYFCDPVSAWDLRDRLSYHRMLLFDFFHQRPQELIRLFSSLLLESHRTGIRAFLNPKSPIYAEQWYSNQGQGLRSDIIFGLPGLAHSEWLLRSNAIRMTLLALWSLIYDHGPGKGELIQAISGAHPRADFEIGVDSTCLAFRLSYKLPNISGKKALEVFIPEPTQPDAPASILSRYADFVRVQTVQETHQIEVVVAFFPSAASSQSPDQLHAMWIDPVSKNVMQQSFKETPGNSRFYQVLPAVSIREEKSKEHSKKEIAAKDRYIQELTQLIRKLGKTLEEKDDLIFELKSGGLAYEGPLPDGPSDPETLLSAFYDRYLDARVRISEYERKIAELEQKGGNDIQIIHLEREMRELEEKEINWVKSLKKSIQLFEKGQLKKAS